MSDSLYDLTFLDLDIPGLELNVALDQILYGTLIEEHEHFN